MMTFTQSVKDGFSRYVDFQGRSPRSGYWWWYLFSLIAMGIATVLDLAISGGNPSFIVFQLIVALGIVLPGLAVTIRRLHDTDRSGWWIFIGLVPIIGTIVLIVFYCTKGTAGPNRFGDDPLDPNNGSEASA
jgi:uncharacterized membrane protein YhaH (DUF805 family)